MTPRGLDEWSGGKLGKILMMDSECPSIYMPIGSPKDGGTCAYSTKLCREHCPSGMIVNDVERNVLRFFQENDDLTISKKLYDEFLVMQLSPTVEDMIQWWAWGDCLPELTDKVAKVIMTLYEEKIPQYGFTRNKKLWKIIPCHEILHIGLTVDDMNKALQMSVKSGKLTVCPDFDTGYARMIFGGKIRTQCSGWWCITESGETRNSNCTQCMAAGEGCHFRY